MGRTICSVLPRLTEVVDWGRVLVASVAGVSIFAWSHADPGIAALYQVVARIGFGYALVAA